jgi:hypothetical protein
LAVNICHKESGVTDVFEEGHLSENVWRIWRWLIDCYDLKEKAKLFKFHLHNDLPELMDNENILPNAVDVDIVTGISQAGGWLVFWTK